MICKWRDGIHLILDYNDGKRIKLLSCCDFGRYAETSEKMFFAVHTSPKYPQLTPGEVEAQFTPKVMYED